MAQSTDQKAYFAGGCFWCLEAAMESLNGVSGAVSGYIKASGTSKPVEVVEVHYDPSVISYDKLLQIFWLNIDPDDAGGQFYDRGDAYKTGIFYQNDAEKAAAEASKMAMEEKLERELAPLILPFEPFTAAEAAHQDFYKTNEDHYKRYKTGSGRPGKLKEVWGDMKAEQP